MVTTFTLTIILAFSESHVKPINRLEKNEKDKINGGSKKSVKEELPLYAIEAGQLIGNAHLDYELVKEKLKYQIDVLCWQKVAKVFCADGEKSLRVVRKEKTLWVPVQITHAIEPLTLTEIEQFHVSYSTFQVWTEKGKLGQKAKTYKPKIFYVLTKDVETNDCVEAFEFDPNDEVSSEVDTKRNRRESNLKQPSRTKFNYFSNSLHDTKVKQIIEKATKGLYIRCKDVTPVFFPPNPIQEDEEIKTLKTKTIKQKDKFSKGSKSSKKSSDLNTRKLRGVLNAKIPGEVFFTDPKLCTYRFENFNQTISDGYILISVKQLLTRDQKINLLPFVIRLGDVCNVPKDILEQNGIRHVHLRYQVSGIAQCISTEKQIDEKIRYDECHVFFMRDSPGQAFIEFLYSQRFKIELRGEYLQADDEHQRISHMFGTETNDRNIAKRLNPSESQLYIFPLEKTKTVTLAVASLSLSDLLLPILGVQGHYTLHNPSSFFHKGLNTMDYTLKLTDSVNINDVHFLDVDTLESSPLTEEILVNCATTIKFESYLMAPLEYIQRVPEPQVFYQRIFIVATDLELAKKLLNEIFLYNQAIYTPELLALFFLKSHFKHLKHASIDSYRMIAAPTSDALSGFMVDNLESFIFFIEGVACGFFASLWNTYRTVSEAKIKLFFNTSAMYTKRIYSDFLNYGGFFSVTMQTTIKSIMEQDQFYLSGNMPVPAWEALKKLHLLLQCQSLKLMLQLNLLPTAQQLLSLDIEWGIPLRWSNSMLLSGINGKDTTENLSNNLF